MNTPQKTRQRKAKNNAWLLTYASSESLALPLANCYELVESPDVVTVPGSPAYALGLLHRQGQWLPLIDLNAYIHQLPAAAITQTHSCLVLAYPSIARSIQLVAVSLPSLPQLIHVSDDQLCGLPEHEKAKSYIDWRQVSVSCFEHNGVPVPIVDARRLFEST